MMSAVYALEVFACNWDGRYVEEGELKIEVVVVFRGPS